MIKRLFLLISISGLVGLSLSAQLIQDLHSVYNPVYNSESTYDSTVVITPFGVIKPGVNYGLSMGTGYSSMGKGVGFSNSYIAPSVSYSPNQKFQIITGVTLSRTGMQGMDIPKEVGNNPVQNSSNPYQAWAYTQYNFSNRFSIYAMGSVSQNQTYYSPFMNSFGNYNSQMYGVGFNYKIGNKTSIGASFNFVNSQYPNTFNGFGSQFP